MLQRYLESNEGNHKSALFFPPCGLTSPFSTVSKVLRQKEKYLNPDDGTRSPIKRTKGRVPDIEKALVNWARNYQRLGQSLNDEMIREKALFFASTCGCPEGKEKVLTSSWLEKFKQKNGLLGAKVRKGSIGIRSGSNSPTRINTDSASSASHSPCSPPDGLASPLSPGQSYIIKKEADAVPDLTGGYQYGHSKSTTSLDTSSTAMTSPTSTMVSDSPFTPTSQARLPSGHNMSRSRSQTFPLGIPIDPNLLTADESMNSQCTKTESDSHVGVTILESPLEMDDHQSRTIKGAHPPTVIKRNRSNPEIKTTSMQPPPSVSKSTTTSPISAGGAPNSPTQDEVRSALELVMTYFQHEPAGLEAQEFISIGKLMQRPRVGQEPPEHAAGRSDSDRRARRCSMLKQEKEHSQHGLMLPISTENIRIYLSPSSLLSLCTIPCTQHFE